MPQSLTVDKGQFEDLDTCHIFPLQAVMGGFTDAPRRCRGCCAGEVLS